MKKIIFLLAVSLSLNLAAQEKPKISSAILAMKNGNMADANEYITEAGEIIEQKGAAEVKDKDLAKFYYYQGLINYNIAAGNNTELKAANPDAIDVAQQSFEKLIALEKKMGKEKWSDDVRAQLPYVAQIYAQRGIASSQEQNFDGAYQDFLITYELKKNNNLGTDTTMLYNAALMAQRAEKYDQALELLEQLMEMEYRGLTYSATETATGKRVDFPSKAQMDMAIKGGEYSEPKIEGDLRADLYVNAANLYMQKGDTATYDKLVAEGRTKFPNNEALLKAELQKFLTSKQYDKALINLNQAIAQEPDNKLFYYIKGFIYHTSMDSVEPARKAYAMSMEKDPNYIEPVYMMGLTYVDEANEVTQQMNALGLNEQSKYKKLQAQQKELFGKAEEYFEKARSIDENDLDTLKALKEVYYKLKKYEEAKELQAEIDARS